MDIFKKGTGKKHLVLSDKFIEHLVKPLDDATANGWKYLDSFTEHGVTKILLEREI